ncbi:MAG: transposase family protein, partial [Actinobacteria bacterium]|nr:transposase family protein [Actinomycetota bacterium]
YAAAGFTPVGPTAGYARNRGTKIRHGQPKLYWLRPLHRHGLNALSSAFDSPLTHPRQGRPVLDMNALNIDGPAGLLAALGQVPEHRKARGIRHQLAALLAVATAAVLSGADSYAAIAQYARTLTQPALATLGIRRNKRTGTHVAPAYQTLRRAIRSVDAHALDAAVTGWLHDEMSAGRLSTGQLARLVIALDGKTVRGAKDAAGNQLHLFAALVHSEATVIAQHPVDSKTNELSGFIPLLDQIAERHCHHEPDQHSADDRHDDNSSSSDNSESGNGEVDGPAAEPGKLHGVIVTADALHTQRGHAGYLREHGGDYVLIAKGNQPALFAALDDLPWTTIEVGHTEEEKGHGRRDVRVLKVIDLTDPAHEHHRVR